MQENSIQNIKDRVKALADSFYELKSALGLEDKQLRVRQLEAVSTDPNLWNDQENARKILQELADSKSDLEVASNLESQVEILTEFAKGEDITAGVVIELEKAEKALQKLKLVTFLSGKYDKKNALVSMHAGQGGTEAMDWTGMLFRMYMRYVEKKGWKMEVVDQTDGEEAGIKSIVFRVEANFA